MLMLRSLAFAVLFRLILAVILIAMLPTLALPRGAIFAMGQLWARLSLWLLETLCGLKVEFRGLENLPAGAAIVAAKHQSALETFALLPHFRDYTFVLKRELTFIPLFGWYMLRAGQIAINRGKGAAALAEVVKRTGEVLGEGRPVLMFPEGTRRPVGAPPDYKAGVARVYAGATAPCLPVAVNTGLFWPRRGLVRRPGRAVIEFLEPIPPGLDKRSFMALLQTRIETATQRLVAEALAEDPSLASALDTPTSTAKATLTGR